MVATNAKQENRQERRLKVFLRVKIQRGSELYTAHLIDVSKNGAQVHCDAAIKSGTFVILEGTDICRRARCIRADRNRIGLRFTSPLSAEELTHLIGGR